MCECVSVTGGWLYIWLKENFVLGNSEREKKIGNKPPSMTDQRNEFALIDHSEPLYFLVRSFRFKLTSGGNQQNREKELWHAEVFNDEMWNPWDLL